MFILHVKVLKSNWSLSFCLINWTVWPKVNFRVILPLALAMHQSVSVTLFGSEIELQTPSFNYEGVSHQTDKITLITLTSEIACFLIAFDGRSWGKGLRWCYYWVVRISLIKGGDRDTKNGKVGLRRVGFCCSQSLDPLLMWINRAGSLSSWYANASYLLSLLGTSDGDKRHINEMGEKFPDAAAFLRWKRLAQEKGKNLPRFTGVPARC